MGLMYIDFETQSEVDIKASGLYKYIKGDYFKPVCMAYCFDDELDIHIWTDDKPFPIESVTSNTLLAFNAEFEYNVLKSDWFRWQEYDFDWLNINHFIDVQAVARTFGFPASLDKLAKALNTPYQKDGSGTRLINLLCKIKNGKIPTYDTDPVQFEELYKYCMQDVITTRACYNMLVKKELSPFEQKVFAHMIEQNETGLPIDINSVHWIRSALVEYVNRCNYEIHRLTDGKISSGKQSVKLANYLKLPNVQAQTLKDYLESSKCTPHQRKIIELRQVVAHSSTAKFDKLIEMVGLDSRVRGNLKYYGGHTGRFAGVGFQLHNLPRAQHDDPEKVIKDFRTKNWHKLEQEHSNLGEAASKLVRPMIMAPEGKLLCVADYVSIENVLLHWLAGDHSTCEDFRKGLDQYKVYATRRFNTSYDRVTKTQRTYAKPCILGLGFGGGAGALIRVASGYGVKLDEKRAESDKQFYRNTYPMIPELWYKVSNSLIKSVNTNLTIDLTTDTSKLRFISKGSYAFIILPSGRFLSYPAPVIQQDWKYNRDCFTYMGEDPYTKQWRRLGDQYRIIDGKPVPDMPIHGGRLVENIIQALARDILVHGALKAKEAGYKIIGSVHDEIISEIPDPGIVTRNDLFCSIICELPKWAEGLPLKAEGYISKRYRKD